MDNSKLDQVDQKVRWHLTGPFSFGTAVCFIVGVALFYAWNLFAIYCGPVISASLYELAPVPTIVTSAAATLGFVSIAVGLYRVRCFNLAGLIASLVASTSFFGGTVLVQFASVDPNAVQLVVDGICRICSCWVIVAWGAQYARLDSHTITVYTLLSFLIALLLCFLLMHSPQIVRILFVGLALPVSMVLFMRADKASILLPAPKRSVAQRESFFGLTWRIILIFFLFGMVTWASILSTQSAPGSAPHLEQLVIVGSGAIVAVLLVLASITEGAFTTSYIYKVVLPLIMSGTLIVAMFNLETRIGPALISIGYTCFDLFCFTLFADACRKTETDAKRAFGWCRAIESSVPLAVIALMWVLGNLLSSGDVLASNLIGPASLFVVIAIIMLDRTSLFERKQLNPKIDYPQAEVLHFARQCEKAIELCALSQREAEVLSLIVRGRSVPHISQRLLISRSTVKTHVTHIYTKLGVNDRQEMIDAIEAISLDEEAAVSFTASV